MAKDNLGQSKNNVANMRSFDNMGSSNSGQNNINATNRPPQKPRMNTQQGQAVQQSPQQQATNMQVPSANNQRVAVQHQQITGGLEANMSLLGKQRKKNVKWKPDDKPQVDMAMPVLSKQKKIMLLAIVGVLVIVILCTAVKPLRYGIQQMFGNYTHAWSERNALAYQTLYTYGDELQEYLSVFTVNNGVDGTLDSKPVMIASDGKAMKIRYKDYDILVNDKDAVVNFGDTVSITMTHESLAKLMKSKGFDFDAIEWYRNVKLPDACTLLSDDEALHKMIDPLYTQYTNIPCKYTRNSKAYQLEDFKTGMLGVVQAIKGGKDFSTLATNLGMTTQEYYDLLNSLEVDVQNITGVDGKVVLQQIDTNYYTMDLGSDLITIDTSYGCTISSNIIYLRLSPTEFGFKYHNCYFDSNVECNLGVLEGTIIWKGQELKFIGGGAQTPFGKLDFRPTMYSEMTMTSDISLTRKASDFEEARKTLVSSDIDFKKFAEYESGIELSFEYDNELLLDSVATWCVELSDDAATLHVLDVSQTTIGRDSAQEIKDATTVANTNANAIYRAAENFIAECGGAPDGAYCGVLTEKSGSLSYAAVFDTKNLEMCLGMYLNSGSYCFVVKSGKVVYAAWSESVDLYTLVANHNIKTSYDSFSSITDVIGTYPKGSGGV